MILADLGYNGSVQNQLAPMLVERMGLKVAGRYLLRHVRLSVIHYVGGAVCLILAVITTYELVR